MEKETLALEFRHEYPPRTWRDRDVEMEDAKGCLLVWTPHLNLGFGIRMQSEQIALSRISRILRLCFAFTVYFKFPYPGALINVPKCGSTGTTKKNAQILIIRLASVQWASFRRMKPYIIPWPIG